MKSISSRRRRWSRVCSIRRWRRPRASRARPRRSLPERWATPTVSIATRPVARGSRRRDDRCAVRQAIGTWLADVPGLPAVVFEDGTERTSSAHDGKSVILAAPITLAGHEKDLALTTTYASDETGDILEADIVFNTRYAVAPMASPSAACSNAFDVGSVATHESGHFFGLDEDWARPRDHDVRHHRLVRFAQARPHDGGHGGHPGALRAADHADGAVRRGAREARRHRGSTALRAGARCTYNSAR